MKTNTIAKASSPKEEKPVTISSQILALLVIPVFLLVNSPRQFFQPSISMIVLQF
jgi:hypothetical protein